MIPLMRMSSWCLHRCLPRMNLTGLCAVVAPMSWSNRSLRTLLCRCHRILCALLDLRLPVARTLRMLTQAESFREAIMADSGKSDHYRLLHQCIGVVRDNQAVLNEPGRLAMDEHPLVLELVLLVINFEVFGVCYFMLLWVACGALLRDS